MTRLRARSSLTAIALVLLGCSSKGDPPAGNAADSGRTETTGWDDDVGGVVGPEWFDEIAVASGINFRHELDKTLVGRFQGAVCVLDVNGDGKQDLLFPSFIEDGASTTRLFVRGASGVSFTEEASTRGLADTGWASACVAFDVDGDNDPDVLTVGLGGARLFRNDGGKFVDDSARLPAIDKEQFLTGAVAFDADGDGDLDLAIASYGKHVPPTDRMCTVDCKLEPETYKGGFTRLFLQKDDGAFEDASSRLGTTWDEPGLVLLATDLDGDDKIDLFVGNDVSTFKDRYFKGDGKGAFTEIGQTLGVAVSRGLKGVCSMSAVDGDVNVDGHLDLLESSYAGDSDPLFICKPGSPCKDIAEDLELFRAMGNLRWGQAIVDLDDDGIPEIFEASGHLYVDADFPMGATKPIGVNLVEASQLLWFHVEPTAALQLQENVKGLAEKTGGRGVAVTDLDGDGAVDLVIGAAVGRPLLLKNIRERRGHHLNLRLRGKGKNTGGIGARVMLVSGTHTTTAMVHAGSSYHSTSDGTVHFGLGSATTADKVEVRWPSGKKSELTAVPADKLLTVDEP